MTDADFRRKARERALLLLAQATELLAQLDAWDAEAEDCRLQKEETPTRAYWTVAV